MPRVQNPLDHKPPLRVDDYKKSARPTSEQKQAPPKGDALLNYISTTAHEQVTIPAPDMRVIQVEIVGDAPLMIHKFSHKAMMAMLEKHTAGPQAKKGRAREAKVIDDVFHEARHISSDGWDGISAAAFRNAMISACRLVGFKMTIAKMSVFIVPDGFDNTEGTPLVRIIGGEPERNIMAARNATGVIDVRVRPMWREWHANLRVRYDADQFSAADIVNLVSRAGAQVGICEGRPDSKMSAGMGLGTFRVVTEDERARA